MFDIQFNKKRIHMKNTELTPAQLKRKFDSLMKKEQEYMRMKNKIMKLEEEIEAINVEISQYFPKKNNKEV
jgi:tetrahydromethanopterin S-methyltransferase subunit G